MKTITITGQYEDIEPIARYIRDEYRVIGEATIGGTELEAVRVKRIYVDDLQPRHQPQRNS